MANVFLFSSTLTLGSCRFQLENWHWFRIYTFLILSFIFLSFSYHFLTSMSACAIMMTSSPLSLSPSEPRVHIRLIALIKNTTCNTSWKLVHNCVDVRKLLWEWDLNEKWRKCFTREYICSPYQKRNLEGPFPQFSSQKELRPKFNSTNWKRLKIEYRASSELLRSSFPNAQSQNSS